MYWWEFVFEVSERQKNSEKVVVHFGIWEVDIQLLEDRCYIFLDLRTTRLIVTGFKLPQGQTKKHWLVRLLLLDSNATFVLL
jgi:hypothetical protein